MKSLAKKAKPSTKALAAAKKTEQALMKMTVKKTILLDLADGAFTDNSVKVKPHSSGVGVVLKCTSRERLLKALAQAGIEATIQKGRKHYIAFPFVSDSSELVVK
jgi:hypothetical protein